MNRKKPSFLNHIFFLTSRLVYNLKPLQPLKKKNFVHSQKSDQIIMFGHWLSVYNSNKQDIHFYSVHKKLNTQDIQKVCFYREIFFSPFLACTGPYYKYILYFGYFESIEPCGILHEILYEKLQYFSISLNQK